MLDISSSHLLLLAIVTLVVIGPKELPRVMRTVGQFLGRARAMANQFRAGIDEMVRESELAEMEKHWKAENERIMREHEEAMRAITADAGGAAPAQLAAPEPAATEPSAPEPAAPEALASAGEAAAPPPAPADRPA